MISIEEALQIVHDQKVVKNSITLSLTDALGYSLAKEVYAPFDLPGFDNSAMDGYAICGHSKTYEIVGEIAAGDTQTHELRPEEAMRIFTGGKVPLNCTSVVMQEKTRVKGSFVEITEDMVAGKNIRKKGGEIAAGNLVFEKGHTISASTIGLLCSLGLTDAEVYTKPRVQLISTGDELVQPGEKLAEGQIYESNGQTLSGALRSYGFSCEVRTQLRDDYLTIKEGIANSLDQCDVLLLSGGISVGEYDFVKKALEENGVKELFYKVFQKPGKPLFFGRKGDKFVFALPGNPASSLTCFYVYVLPLLQKISGSDADGLLRIFAPLRHSYEMKSDRPSFLKARLENKEVNILDGQSSSMIYSMSKGNALVYLKSAATLNSGDLVECLLF